MYQCEEKWLPIKGDNIKPMYEVSNTGKVRNINTQKILKPYLNKQTGYYQVSLMRNDDSVVKKTIHRLVMETFTDEPEKINDKAYVVNHINNIDDISETNPKGCNYLDNLEWVTYSDNAVHAVLHGKIPVGEDAPTAKSDNELVHAICKLFEENKSYKEVKDILGLPDNKYITSLLIRIRTGKQWKSISRFYKFEKKPCLRRHTDEDINKICEALDSGITSPTKIQEVTGIEEDYSSFKKLVWFIRNRKCYKDISDNYNWWKQGSTTIES